MENVKLIQAIVACNNRNSQSVRCVNAPSAFPGSTRLGFRVSRRSKGNSAIVCSINMAKIENETYEDSRSNETQVSLS